jgi:hypothetical protein
MRRFRPPKHIPDKAHPGHLGSVFRDILHLVDFELIFVSRISPPIGIRLRHGGENWPAHYSQMQPIHEADRRIFSQMGRSAGRHGGQRASSLKTWRS